MMSMRRKDRQVTEKEEILQIMQNCDVVRLGIKDEDSYPYIVPLNFGMEDVEGQVVLYLHSALEGHKLDLLRKDSYVSFEMDRNHVFYSDQERGYCTMNFQSVMGRGSILFVSDLERKTHALTVLTDHYHQEHFAFNPAAIPRTEVMELHIDFATVSAKHKQTKIPVGKPGVTTHPM